MQKPKPNGKNFILPVAFAIIYNAEGKILLLRRSAKSRYGRNLWQFPGGRLEFGETPMEALVREVEEEIKCRFIPLSENVVATVSNIIELEGDRCQLLGIAYEGRIDGNVVISDEHSEFEWFSLEEALKMPDLEEGARKILLALNGRR